MSGPMMSPPIEYPYFWRVKSRLPERKGERCRVIVRGRMNSCLVEFTDGVRVVTSRNYLRRADKAAEKKKRIATDEDR